MNKKTHLHIGFDAKRAFFNHSGLGNYSRDLIRALSEEAPENHYYLFKHKDVEGIKLKKRHNVSTLLPQSDFYQRFGKLWRYKGISQEIKSYPIDIYHGLSQEMPMGIENSGVKTVVTIHDCIFLRYPELFDIGYRIIFKKKYAHACKVSDRIIAISEQTKADIIHYFDVPEEKIDVVYQGCNRAFYDEVDRAIREQIRAKYKLPEKFILYVGTIEERKNLLSVFEAMAKSDIQYPVVAIGRSTKYTEKVKQFVKDKEIKDVTFIHTSDFSDFPAIYQMATMFVYPSIFEGFGIPILEALNSGTPVITTAGGVFPEVGGDAALYVEYGNNAEMAQQIKKLLESQTLREELATKGKQQALKFREKEMAANLISVYQKVML